MEKFEIRKPVVSGQFYPASKEELKRQIAGFIDKQGDKLDAVACMLPHAGYVYSGAVAAETVSQINIKDKVILLGPNHTGYGSPFSIMTKGSWQTPLGEIRIDPDLARQILKKSKYLADDFTAHLYEHSLEVELPILQYFKSDFEIVPIVVSSGDTAVLKEIGKELASAIKESKVEGSTLLVASSDMTHYEPKAVAQKKDEEAIMAILELNEDKLAKKVKSLDISMCGYAPVIVMLSAAKILGAGNAKLVKYQTSGDVTADNSAVVGYAGIIIYR